MLETERIELVKLSWNEMGFTVEVCGSYDLRISTKKMDVRKILWGKYVECFVSWQLFHSLIEYFTRRTLCPYRRYLENEQFNSRSFSINFWQFLLENVIKRDCWDRDLRSIVSVSRNQTGFVLPTSSSDFVHLSWEWALSGLCDWQLMSDVVHAVHNI